MESEPKIQALIVDDEEDVIQNLSFLINRYCPELSISGTARSVTEAIEKINDLGPQLVFLDIHLPGSSGFDLLDRIPQKDFELIFVTSYSQHAIRAFKYSAVDYLLKPVDIEELTIAVKKAIERIQSGELRFANHQLLGENLSKKIPSRLAVNTMEGIQVIKIADILSIEADGSYSTIYIKGDKRLVISKNLKEFQELLNDQEFFRVHNSHIVNIEHVLSVWKKEGGTIVLSDGREIPVSRRRRTLFEDYLKKALK